MGSFDIYPFRLPGTLRGECRFEEPRDIQALELTFRSQVPRKLEVWYLQRKWPQVRFEDHRDMQDPARFGWVPMDDQWNGSWRRAAIRRTVRGRALEVSFRPLSADGFPEVAQHYDVTFRRTLGLRLAGFDADEVRGLAVFTRSAPAHSTVRVRLDAGRRTRTREVRLSTYNARIVSTKPRGRAGEDGEVRLACPASGLRLFEVSLAHMAPWHRYLGDDALLTLALDHQTFTVRLQDLEGTGPIWYQEEGVYVTDASRDEPLKDYRARHAAAKTVLQKVAASREQSFAGAFHGQPRGHAPNFSLGLPNSPQRFWLEANGDLLLHRANVDFLGRRPQLAAGFLNKGTARLFFGLERWITCARFDDPSTAPVYTMRFRRGELGVQQETLCVPLLRSILDGPLAWEEPVAALVRFRFRNTGDSPGWRVRTRAASPRDVPPRSIPGAW